MFELTSQVGHVILRRTPQPERFDRTDQLAEDRLELRAAQGSQTQQEGADLPDVVVQRTGARAVRKPAEERIDLLERLIHDVAVYVAVSFSVVFDEIEKRFIIDRITGHDGLRRGVPVLPRRGRR
jgi:hypothetical protein